MRLQYLSGNRTAALRQYERCSVALNEELGVKPARVTQSLYDQIRDDHLEHHSTNKPRAIPIAESLTHLKQVGDLLTQVQDAVQHGLREIELVMKGRR